MIQEKNNVGKDEAQKITIELEQRVRSSDPNMGSDYRSRIMIILKLIKHQLMDCRELITASDINYQDLKNKIDEYSSIHGDQGDVLEEGLSLNRDPKSEIEMNGGESGVTVN